MEVVALCGVMLMSVASVDELRGVTGLYKGPGDMSMPDRLFTRKFNAGESYPIVLCVCFHGSA